MSNQSLYRKSEPVRREDATGLGCFQNMSCKIDNKNGYTKQLTETRIKATKSVNERQCVSTLTLWGSFVMLTVETEKLKNCCGKFYPATLFKEVSTKAQKSCEMLKEKNMVKHLTIN